MPEEVGINRNDISVLFGNLLENAIEASVKLPVEKRFVEIKGGMINEGVLAFTVENTYLSEPKRRERRFNSSKHEGLGIGTESVCDIVERYDGKICFDTNADRFCVSVMMYTKSSAEDEEESDLPEKEDTSSPE